jgi:hypothetical protein
VQRVRLEREELPSEALAAYQGGHARGTEHAVQSSAVCWQSQGSSMRRRPLCIVPTEAVACPHTPRDLLGHRKAPYNVGCLNHEAGDLDAAEAAWLCAAGNGDPCGLRNLGVLYKKRGDLAQAESAWTRVLSSVARPAPAGSGNCEPTARTWTAPRPHIASPTTLGTLTGRCSSDSLPASKAARGAIAALPTGRSPRPHDVAQLIDAVRQENWRA